MEKKKIYKNSVTTSFDISSIFIDIFLSYVHKRFKEDFPFYAKGKQSVSVKKREILRKRF